MTRAQMRAAFLCLLAVALLPWRWGWVRPMNPVECRQGYIEAVGDDGAHLQCLRPGGRVAACGDAGLAAGRRVHVPTTPTGPCRVEPRPMEAARRLALGLRLDANAEPVDGLLAVPGIGPRLAEKIRAARPFHSETDLERVRGIGPRTRARLVRYLTVGAEGAGRSPAASARGGGGG